MGSSYKNNNKQQACINLCCYYTLKNKYTHGRYYDTMKEC